MAKISSRLIIGTGSVGTIGGLRYLVSVLTDTTDTLENYLSKNKLFLRSNNWEEVVAAYLLEFDEETKGTNDDVIKPEHFEKWCEDNTKKKIKSTNSTEFKTASKWCINFQTIENKFKNQFEEEPKKLTTKYQKLKKNIQDLIDKEVVENVLDTDENIKGHKTKKWCDENKKRRFSKDDKDYVPKIKIACIKESQ